ncbi:hypothetical protein C8J27_101348 [Rhodobacter aestuarii]|uniref:AAA+ family ATPase n=1 Tax=Rhodobacter aestuarii TaxID=453582 RepID=A0A1N7J3H5_9RHOB|nr:MULTISPECIES: hypothetical protein [Rhodobacter]PTV97236.1 hypothetical protein C8J27_101348 [Rhodobacter aestuarii]SIS43787.1 hypothetical protein SAMN05421580_101294 [Rhodobacter aestuarii]SOB99295.1 hypothetical protein SAMN05877809_102416 [Rhodobacter sp. JA431]
MKQRILLAGVAAAALGLGGWFAFAQDSGPQILEPPGEELDLPEPSGRDDMAAGKSLVERGAELFLRGLLDEVSPHLDEMQQGLGEAAEALGPKLKQVLALIDDIRYYNAPERLPNGDIIMRRVPGAPEPPPLLAPDDRAKPKTGLRAPITDL